jgi:regulator of protease activity HflC (stomatin/prohibitin superfamily)
MFGSVVEIFGVSAATAIVGVGLISWFVSRCVKIVQQGSVGVVKRLGEFKSVDQPGARVLMPFIDRMEKVDMREFPMTGDQQAVITKDNVSLQVSATIFCQVIDVKSALFEINDYVLAVDQLSRTALRAVFGELSLDQALSERETINIRMQDHMADATVKWGVRLNRIEILDITPPINVVTAMSEQKEAEQHK